LVLADPPIVSADGVKRLTLGEMADLHELLDLRDEAGRRAQEAAASDSSR